VLDSIELDDSLLSSNQLSGTIPSTIGSLTGLQQLYETHLKLAATLKRHHHHDEALSL